MTAQKGSLVLLKVSDGGSPTETFTTVGGLRATGFIHNNQPLDASNLSSGAWRMLRSGVGVCSITISGAGAFTDAASEETVRGLAMSGEVRNYRMTFGNGDSMEGPFLITSYQRLGPHHAEETYALTLASAGEVTFAPA